MERDGGRRGIGGLWEGMEGGEAFEGLWEGMEGGKAGGTYAKVCSV